MKINNIDINSWGEFKIKDIFEIISSKKKISCKEIEMHNKGDYPYITATKENNGSCGFYDYFTEKGNCLTISMFADVNYQPIDFSANGNVFQLYLKFFLLNEKIALFLKTVLQQEKWRYSYGRVCSQDTLGETIIKLPINQYKQPSFELMEKFIEQINKKINFSGINTSLPKLQSFNISEWKEFKIEKLFEVKGTKTTPLNRINEKGFYHYVTTKSNNNGVECLNDFFTEKGNVLVIESAVNGFCSFQEINFVCSDHIEKLVPSYEKLINPSNFNKYVALFFVTLLKQEQWRYFYARKFNQKRIRETIIKLPINSLGKPNLEFMKEYIKSLPYSKFI